MKHVGQHIIMKYDNEVYIQKVSKDTYIYFKNIRRIKYNGKTTCNDINEMNSHASFSKTNKF